MSEFDDVAVILANSKIFQGAVYGLGPRSPMFLERRSIHRIHLSCLDTSSHLIRSIKATSTLYTSAVYTAVLYQH